MEFFAIANIAMSPETIREKITMAALPDYCESFALVEAIKEDNCEVESIWDRFQVTRQEIYGGLRFTMPTCPNCFAWTITSGLPPAPEKWWSTPPSTAPNMSLGSSNPWKNSWRNGG